MIERTLRWLVWCRQLNKDYELLLETAKTFIYLATIRIIVRRLA
ncbi:MAG: transposase [Nostoc sp. NMS9]|nr:transposase [Nostoc sp. NMS9]